MHDDSDHELLRQCEAALRAVAYADDPTLYQARCRYLFHKIRRRLGLPYIGAIASSEVMTLHARSDTTPV